MNKYIPADKLITALEKRMEETKSVKPAFDQFWAGQISAFKGAIDIAKSLQREQPTRGYDEAYLNECIAKARKTWKGVDVDKYMDEMRGREQEQPEVDLEEEILNWIGDEGSCKNGKWTWYECNKMLRHFYELGLNARKEESK